MRRPPVPCIECGIRPEHWRFVSGSKCRDCAERAGHRLAFRVEVDVDLVLEAFGGDYDKAEAFLEAVAT